MRNTEAHPLSTALTLPNGPCARSSAPAQHCAHACKMVSTPALRAGAHRDLRSFFDGQPRGKTHDPFRGVATLVFPRFVEVFARCGLSSLVWSGLISEHLVQGMKLASGNPLRSLGPGPVLSPPQPAVRRLRSFGAAAAAGSSTGRAGPGAGPCAP